MSAVYELIANLLKALFDKSSQKNLLQSTADFLHITQDQLMTNITPILRGKEQMVRSASLTNLTTYLNQTTL